MQRIRYSGWWWWDRVGQSGCGEGEGQGQAGELMARYQTALTQP